MQMSSSSLFLVGRTVSESKYYLIDNEIHPFFKKKKKNKENKCNSAASLVKSDL